MTFQLRRLLIGATILCASATPTSNVFAADNNAVGAQISEASLRALTICDGSFFRSLNQDFAGKSTTLPLVNNGQNSWLKVPDRKDDEKNAIAFPAPMDVAGFQLLSYYDEFYDLGPIGLIYYWGFTVLGNVEDVAAKIKPLMQDGGARMKRDGDTYARVEVRYPGTSWQPSTAQSGTVTGNNKTERVFLVEVYEKRKDAVRVSCTVQGKMSPDLLREVRPDIAADNMPVN